MALPAGFIMPELNSFEQDHEKEFDNKNWELQNILDNSAIGTTIAHIRGANAVAITGTVASFLNIPLGLTSIPIILAGIRSEQRLFRIKKHFTSTDRYLRIFEIGALKQGVHESVSSYWAKILKYGDQLDYTPAQKKTQFMFRVKDDIKEEIYRIGQYRPINDILDSLAELELRCEVLEQLHYSYESNNLFDEPPVPPKPNKLHSARIDRLESIIGVSEPNKNQFCIKLHGKTYVIPTYSKALVAKEPSKEEQNQVSTDFLDNSKKDLKKSAKILKSAS
ncbi:2561_t:CDS:2 [Gigaspora margarita]|uniref:2561_t:CDS:1 n=1 Tax=Gigaspora margarita TaxID=4874 RepID=A0ABN7UKM1_GIGMA|nr:2561_t:CDS:2 [Gigaspora margarita]